MKSPNSIMSRWFVRPESNHGAEAELQELVFWHHPHIIPVDHDRYEAAPPALDQYWHRARLPLNSLVFLLPLLLVYEVGIWTLGGAHAEEIRNGADFWLRSLLSWGGLDHPLLLPALVIAGLLCWQIGGKFPWKVSTDTLLGMFSESLLFGFCLVVLGQLQNLFFSHFSDLLVLSLGKQSMLRVVSFVGAGVYEEVMFRLCLLPLAYGFFRLLMLKKGGALALSIISTSLIFSLAHYVGGQGEAFSLFSFAFRALAGMFFCLLFYLRGFGIAVGSHAMYDVIVGVLMEWNAS